MELISLNKEYNDLDSKIIKLKKYIKENDLDKKEKVLVVAQLEYMKKYLQAIENRIKNKERKRG